MSAHETTRPSTPVRHTDQDRAHDTGTVAVSAPGKDRPPVPAPLLDPWLAFLSAGMAASAAGYVLASAPTFRDAFRSMGVELPWITTVVLAHPVLVPLALLALAAGLLVLGGVRRVPSPDRDVLGFTRVLAAAVGALACGCIAANALGFQTLHKALQN